jgi:very-short-patch-repair endonuclease
MKNTDEDRHEFFLKVTSSRAKSELIDSEATLTKFGYLPNSLGPFSAKRVVAICEFCDERYESCLNTLSKRKSAACQDCIGLASLHATTKSDVNKKSFASDYGAKNRNMICGLVHLIDTEATKIKFGYDPATLTLHSSKKIIHICPHCSTRKPTTIAYFVSQAGQVTCKKCESIKLKNTIRTKYGVSSIVNIPAVKAKLSDPLTERLVKSTLERIGTKYERQYEVGPYSFDFYIPKANLLVECQGDFWHDFKHNGYVGTSRDRGKATYVQRHTNYKLISIWEHEINLGRVFAILSRHLSITVDPITDDLNSLTISSISADAACAFFSQYHYIGFTKNACHYGAFTQSGILVAACSFGSPIRQCTCAKVSRLSGTTLTNKSLRELKRFCISPSFKTSNAGSNLINRFVKAFKKEKRETIAITSFSDPTVGHSGTIYAAAGWVKLGNTDKSYHYLDPVTIKAIHKKTVYAQASNMGLTEQELVKFAGLTKVMESEKVLWFKKL